MIQNSKLKQSITRSWWLVGGLLAICFVLIVYGILGLSLATYPSLTWMFSRLIISGAITLSLGGVGLVATLSSFFKASPQRASGTVSVEQPSAETFKVTEAMLEPLKVLKLGAKVGEQLPVDTLSHYYKQRARKLHPDRNRNRSQEAHAEFLALSLAYETLKTLIQRQLDPLGLKAEITARFAAMDDELNALRAEFKDLGEQLKDYDQREEEFIQGVKRLDQDIDEVSALVRQYDVNFERHTAKLNQYLVHAEQHIAEAAKDSAQVKEAEKNVAALTARYAALMREVEEQEARMEAEWQEILELYPEVSPLMTPSEEQASLQQATNRYRLMAASAARREEGAINPVSGRGYDTKF